MQWVVEADLAAYADRVQPWLERDAVTNTVPATLVMSRRDATLAEPTPWLAWLAHPAGTVAGVALAVSGRGLVLSALPPGAAADLAGTAPAGLPMVSGGPGAVGEFLPPYAGRTGASARPGSAQRLYVLGELVQPPAPGGRLREATAADTELCTAWFAEFGREAHRPGPPDAAAATRRVIAQRRALFWDVDGTPVCVVGHSPAVAGVLRVGPVWTVPEYRGRGYAAAATAALCARLRAGWGARQVILFADTANPTSTGIYRRIGFRPVGEWEEWSLEY